MSEIDDIAARVLPRYGLSGASVRPFGGGLINRTYLVEAGPLRRILQWVNPIFPAGIQKNLSAVTAHLEAAGLVTPRLVPTLEGQSCLPLGERDVWRLQTFVEGSSFDVVSSPAQARAGGRLIGRFHAALASLSHEFVALRVGVHDTPRHLERLEDAARTLSTHRLHAEVAPLADEVLRAAEALPRLPQIPDMTGHGDLKFNNLLFAGAAPPLSEQALCLIDLDTVGPVALAFELGDAWRSWCNRSGEDVTGARLDLDVMRASFEGWGEGLGRAPTDDERRALLLGPDWVSLELSARFLGDALREAYFGWDPARFAGRGEHNLVRACGQLSLYHAFLASRGERARLLGTW